MFVRTYILYTYTHIHIILIYNLGEFRFRASADCEETTTTTTTTVVLCDDDVCYISSCCAHDFSGEGWIQQSNALLCCAFSTDASSLLAARNRMESRPVILCGRRTTQRRLRYGCPGFDERCSWNTVASNCSTVLFLMLIRASFSSLHLLYTRSFRISPLPRLCGCPW